MTAPDLRALHLKMCGHCPFFPSRITLDPQVPVLFCKIRLLAWINTRLTEVVFLSHPPRLCPPVSPTNDGCRYKGIRSDALIHGGHHTMPEIIWFRPAAILRLNES